MAQKSFFLLSAAATLGVAQAQQGAEESFDEWTSRYGRRYSSVEEVSNTRRYDGVSVAQSCGLHHSIRGQLQLTDRRNSTLHCRPSSIDIRVQRAYRKSLYDANIAGIQRHNEAAASNDGWRMSVNHFADLTPGEWSAQFSGGYVSDYDRDVTGEWLQPRQQPSSASTGAGSGSGDCFPWECPSGSGSGSGSGAAASAGSSRSDSGSHEGNPDWIRGVGAPSPSSDPNTKQSANLRRAAASPVVQPSERPFESTSYSGWKGFTNTWLWTKPIIAGSPSPTNSPTPSITPSTSPSPSISSVPSPSGSPSSAPRPESVDWSSPSLQAVSPVRAQGSCGACFAFASAQALESATKIKTGILPVLSDQQLLDCGAGTCAGGGIRATWNYIKDAGGMCAGSAYPYTGVKASCMASTCTKQATVSSFLTVQRQSQAALEYAVALQPVVTPIQADQADFMFYSGGIMDGTCGTALNHAVVVVGYGTDGATGKKYWKIKNSWGPSWGENGYVRISRGDQWNPTGQCGIQMDPTIPVI